MQRLIWKFLIGYVTITLEGLYLEPFLNELREKYRIRKVKRLSYTVIEITVSARNRGDIISMAERRSIRCTDIREDRAAHISAEIFRRWWIILVSAAILLVSVWLSGYCFRIELIGNEKISDFELGAFLEENSIAVGKRKSTIDVLAVRNLIYREYSSLAYCEVYFDGTALCIIFEEGNGQPALRQTDPCSIVAAKRGVILSLTVGEGMAAAEPGDIVEPGDVLIKGAYLKKDHSFLVHARGKICAQVDYFGKSGISVSDGYVRTGRSVSQRHLCLGRLKIAIRGNNPFELYEEELVSERLIPENMPSFIRITDTVYYECVRGVSDDARLRAETQLREKAYYDALSQIPMDAEIIEFSSAITERDGKLTATAVITVKEDIGEQIPVNMEDIEITEETGDI